MKVLYVNHGLARECGVQDLGRRHANALAGSEQFALWYRECDTAEEYAAAFDEIQPDVIIFNYMPIVMPWIGSPLVRERRAKSRVVVQHHYGRMTALYSHGGLFDAAIVLDPTVRVIDDQCVFPMHRPMIDGGTPGPIFSPTVQVGSFGFGMPHKRFDLVAREVNRCFDHAVFNLHLTVGHFVGDYSPAILESCRAELTKPDVTLNHTSDFLPEPELVQRLSRNHVNVLLYELDQEAPGTSSALDYLIAAGRPILVSDCKLFAHADVYRPPVSLADIIDNFDVAMLRASNLRLEHLGKLRAETEQMLAVL